MAQVCDSLISKWRNVCGEPFKTADWVSGGTVLSQEPAPDHSGKLRRIPRVCSKPLTFVRLPLRLSPSVSEQECPLPWGSTLQKYPQEMFKCVSEPPWPPGIRSFCCLGALTLAFHGAHSERVFPRSHTGSPCETGCLFSLIPVFNH